MASLKDALSSLSPFAFEDLPSEDKFPQFVKQSFTHAETLLNSVPVQPQDTSKTFEPHPTNSAHNAEETYCDPTSVPLPLYRRDSDAAKAWGKPYKMSAKENPLAVQVYKMAAHDRHGAWFARRSVHQGLGFEKWKKAAQHEFLESLKVQEGPGSGAVRGVGADRRLEKLAGPHNSKIEVWQTSSAFPGPVTPRESLILLFSSSNALFELPQVGDVDGKPEESRQVPRHWLAITRPTTHTDAPNRPNLVKMEYESTEMIREIPIEGNPDPESNPIEWIMISRSDPGGGIPRFMVERGTPASIVGDVSKFLTWATGKSEADFDEDGREQSIDAVIEQQNKQLDQAEETQVLTDDLGQTEKVASPRPPDEHEEQAEQAQDGLVSKFTTAVESSMSGYLPVFQQQAGSLRNGEHGDDDSSSDISDSSDNTFRSALHEQRRFSLGAVNDSGTWTDSSTSLQNPQAAGHASHERVQSKEIDKLLQKRAALDERARKDREAFAQKAAQVGDKEQKERNKILDKQEKERKKREERYQRQLAKIDEQRIKEERKDEARQKKAEDKDAMKKMKQEVTEWKRRCQVAERETDLLRKQVEGLQRENTAIVARLPEEEVKAMVASGRGGGVTSAAKAESTRSNRSGSSSDHGGNLTKS
ncbi:MAG: hypothetical protein Q9162_006448 [Coniocarpon cinnabarinum]